MKNYAFILALIFVAQIAMSLKTETMTKDLKEDKLKLIKVFVYKLNELEEKECKKNGGDTDIGDETEGNNSNDIDNNNTEDNTNDNTEDTTNENIEDNTNDNTEDNTNDNTEDNLNNHTEDNTEDNLNNNTDNTDDNTEDNTEDNKEDSTEEDHKGQQKVCVWVDDEPNTGLPKYTVDSFLKHDKEYDADIDDEDDDEDDWHYDE
jgi:hypothetical protein